MVNVFTCTCCQLHHLPEHGDGTRCTTCREHYFLQGESHERTVQRHADHEAVLRVRYESAAASANENEERMKAALRTRDRWKHALVTMLEQHEPKGTRCACGKQDPCPTVAALRRAHPGIARDVDRLLTLMPKRLEFELFGRHHPDRWERELMEQAAFEEEQQARRNGSERP